MKTLCQMFAATVLSLALTVSAFAGQIDSMGVASPPPPPPSEETSTNITTTVLLTIFSLIPIP